MHTTTWRKSLMAAAASLTAALVISGCSGSASLAMNSDGSVSGVSRVEIYSSIGALARSSDLRVVGTVTSQRAAADIDGDPDTEFTISTVEVKNGSSPNGRATVEVRQLPIAEAGEGAGLLEVGRTYLLYLTESGLDGALADQYYVTGVTAGIYRADDKTDGQFDRVDPNSGDDLPATLTEQAAPDAAQR